MSTIKYIPEPVVLTANISGYDDGDYAQIYSNSGDGDIDYDTAHDTRQIDLTDDQWTTLGWGDMPWGDGAWGDGYTTMEIIAQADVPGLWGFGFIVYDTAGNSNEGTPGEAEVYITPRPKKPGAMTQSSYDSTNNILTLTVST